MANTFGAITRRNFLKGAAVSAVGVAALGMVGSVSAAEEAPAASKFDNDAINEYIISEFTELAKVPRPSSNTEKITEYMVQWGLDHGFETVADEVGNVIIDAPATPGYEDAPLTVLQCHTDMVVVANDPNFDKLNTGITVIQTDDGLLTADGTSLGGDDGIGIATSMYLITAEEVTHGPLRVICTINEEGGSPSGVGNLDPATVADAQFLINIDSEDYGTCTVSACGFAGYRFNVPLEWEAPETEGKVAYCVDLTGLKGGHSGVDIHKNRASAIKAVNYCLAWAKYNGIDFQLASFTGGTGSTAVPALASAVFVMDEANVEAFAALMDKTIEAFSAQFSATEAGFSFTYSAVEMPETVLTQECSYRFVDLVAATEDGINTISQRYAGITESSFNLGRIVLTAESTESITISVSMRTSSAWPTLLANMQFYALGKALGIEITVSDQVNVGWVEKEGDMLPALYAMAFKAHTGDDCIVTAVHGGLECADFARYNENLQIISVGPTVTNPHSTSEFVPIETVGKTAGAIATVLEYIATGVTVD